MRNTPSLLALVVCVACSSSTSPSGPLTGTWNVVSPNVSSVQQFQLVLVQHGDQITGTGMITGTGRLSRTQPGPTLSLQVVGKSGLKGVSCSGAVLDIPCVAQFQLTATDATGDTIRYTGLFAARDTLAGNVGVTGVFPLQNVDGLTLKFTH